MLKSIGLKKQEWCEIEDDIKGIENSIDFEVVDKMQLLKTTIYTAGIRLIINKGIYTFTYDEWMYVLTSDGEKPTGGYSLEIKHNKNRAKFGIYLRCLNCLARTIVTQALTYLSVIVGLPKHIQQVDWNLAPNDVMKEN